MQKLPQGLPLPLMQTRWATEIDPVLALPPNQGIILKGIELVAGTNVINHKLGRKPQGWIIADQDAAASVYRSASFNALTLTLTSDNPVTLSLWVY